MKISDNSSPKAVFDAHSACTFVQHSEKEGKLIFFFWSTKVPSLSERSNCVVSFFWKNELHCFYFRWNYGLFLLQKEQERRTITILLLCKIIYYNLLCIWNVSKQPIRVEWHLTLGTQCVSSYASRHGSTRNTCGSAGLVSPERHALSYPAAAKAKVEPRAFHEHCMVLHLEDIHQWWHCRGQVWSPLDASVAQVLIDGMCVDCG